MMGRLPWARKAADREGNGRDLSARVCASQRTERRDELPEWTPLRRPNLPATPAPPGVSSVPQLLSAMIWMLFRYETMSVVCVML
jgi:hypothetical protein